MTGIRSQRSMKRGPICLQSVAALFKGGRYTQIPAQGKMSVMGMFRQLTNQGKGDKIVRAFQVRCVRWKPIRGLNEEEVCSTLGNALSQSPFLPSCS
jgi:hypothetical protein